jgi:hypothetical protein
MSLRRIGRALIAAGIASLVLAGGAQAATYSGQTGSFSESGVTCYLNPQYPAYNRVIVQGPNMSSSDVPHGNTFTVGGGWYGGGWHVQRVGYRAYLYKWNGSSWGYTGVYGPLEQGQTADALQPVVWDDGSGSTWFNTPGHGYYRVYLRLYWFADSQANSGSAEGMATVYEQGRATYCGF